MAQPELPKKMLRVGARLVYAIRNLSCLSVLLVTRNLCFERFWTIFKDLGSQYFVEFSALEKKLFWQQAMNGWQSTNHKKCPRRSSKAKRKVNMDVMKQWCLEPDPACKNLRFKRNPRQLTNQSTFLKQHISCTQTSRVICRKFDPSPQDIRFPDHTFDPFAVIHSLLGRFSAVIPKD